jgi:flagella basal body P-ring formation protein FlgA
MTALRRRARAAIAGATVWLATGAVAGERLYPVPRVTIYPGDKFDDARLEDQPLPFEPGPENGIVELRRDLIGKVSRRTLLPGQPIPLSAVENPRIISVGAQVRIIFAEDGLFITALGVALQQGAIGEVIRVRNHDSGLMVNGVIQPDGSIKVSEG